MSSASRSLNYALAINEGLRQMMESDDSVFLIGQGLKSPWYVGQTCTGLLDVFGEMRVIDTPVSENAITGAAVGASIAGMKAVVVHPRVDFMLYALDPVINQAANWYYMNGGRSSVPVVIWGIINRGGEQAAQHSQAFHSLFAHIPGLKVVMPATPYDAKGLMVAAIRDPDPVVFMDDRWLYGIADYVPEELYEVEIGKAVVRKSGSDITLVTSSYVAYESFEAVKALDEKGPSVEIIDLRTIKPLDEECILNSVAKTGRLLVVDGGWKSFGISAEIAALVSEKAFHDLKAPVQRLALPDVPAPANRHLEDVYYIRRNQITEAIFELSRR
ncbi:MAG: alpha-ketoacid dehydrogenase subunit beta [Deltaproteobacteria bacterium]|nr:alpha-ketoacid dehydrogenase subunit beta [Deltaproteobacteria bacterium]